MRSLNNVSCAPGRRYSDCVKEFANTLNYYSPKAYQYVRSILPLPHPPLLRKWSSVAECEPGFIKEAFDSIQKDATSCPEKKYCFLVIDAMSTRTEALWGPKQDKYYTSALSTMERYQQKNRMHLRLKRLYFYL